MTLNSIIITRPAYDYTTRYISAWAGLMVSLAKGKVATVVDLAGSRASFKEFSSVMKKFSTAFVFINGHGNRNSVCGHDGEPLLTVGQNESLISGSVVYALSCSSARTLGYSAVQSGCRSYIGYEEDFVFAYDSNFRTKPLHDKTAALFLEPSNQVVTALLKGHTAEEAHANSKEAFVRNIRKLLTSQSSTIQSPALRFLIWDYQHQVCLGDGNARI